MLSPRASKQRLIISFTNKASVVNEGHHKSSFKTQITVAELVHREKAMGKGSHKLSRLNLIFNATDFRRQHLESYITKITGELEYFRLDFICTMSVRGRQLESINFLLYLCSLPRYCTTTLKKSCFLFKNPSSTMTKNETKYYLINGQ